MKVIGTIAVIVIAICFCGCGGDNGTASTRTTSIEIEPESAVPTDISINHGNRVTWTNSSSTSFKVVSGTLEPVDEPVTHAAISSLPDGTFTPESIEGSFGDTIVWRNDDVGTEKIEAQDIDLEIIDASGDLVTSLLIQPSETASFSDFPRAGKYTFRIAGTESPVEEITLYGVPTPDDTFESMYLSEGQRFSYYFFQSGTQSYYIIGRNDTKSCMTANISVD